MARLARPPLGNSQSENDKERDMKRAICLLATTVVAMAGCGDDQSASGPAQATIEGTASAGIGRLPAPRRRAPRPVAPLSGSYSTSRQPIFQWTPDVSATVQICDDRACAHLFASISGQGAAQPESPLRAGVVFWRVVTGPRTSAVWQLTIPGRDSGQSTSWGVTPDFNGDGIADVTIGAPATGAGSVSIYNGGPDLGIETPQVLSGGDQFGHAVAAAGDLNGDGFVDLAVGGGSAPGSVTVYLGGPNGATGGTPLAPGPVTAGFGFSIASAGDVNGDGYGDLLVGGHEAAQIFLGGPGGIAPSAALSLPGGTDNGLDGTLVQGPSDVNADGSPDLLVGGLLYLSGPGGLAPQSGFSTTSNIGSFAGDENNDGFGDVASYTVDSGTPSGASQVFYLLAQAGEFAFETAGDLDGDGYTDTIFNISSFLAVPELERVYFGAPGSCGATNCRRFAAITVPGHNNNGGTLSAFIAAAGDVDGDGLDDLVASTPDTGTVYVFRSGGATGMPIDFSFPTLTGAPGYGTGLPTLFGSALLF
jgi:FG-GAP-like repeat/FG-GAP repeat